MSDVVSHKCYNCGSALNYSVEDQTIKCVSCGSVYTKEDMEQFTQMLEGGGEDLTGKNVKIEWQFKDLSQDYHVGDKKAYRCKSCGGNIIVDDSVAATKCPYCDNPALLSEKLSGMLKPDVIIPFAIRRDEMKTRLKDFLRWKFLVPKVFRNNHRIEQSSGIYVPFWLFDVDVHADAVFSAQHVSHYSSGDYNVKETKHYKCYRSGDFDFENLPADASESMKDEYMDSIEPFDMSKMVEFDGMYMAGFMADKYTVTSDECAVRINKRVKWTCESELSKTVKGYSSTRLFSSNISNRGKANVKYAMMPVWVMATRYKDKVYEFVMNGQTGKVVGSVPISIGRCLSMFGILWAIGILITLITAYFL